jgi:hypothetical protein
MSSVRTLLDGEIKNELEILGEMKVGSDEYKVTIDGVTKLVDKLNDINRIDHEYQDKFESREIEKELKLKQMKSDNIDKVVKNVLTVGTFVGTAALTVWGTQASFEFEKEGTITTIMGRGFINKLLPKK